MTLLTSALIRWYKFYQSKHVYKCVRVRQIRISLANDATTNVLLYIKYCRMYYYRTR